MRSFAEDTGAAPRPEAPLSLLPPWWLVKSLPAMRETQVQSLGQEDPLEKEMVTHSSVLSWRISRTEAPGGLWSLGSQKVGHD